MRKIYLILNFIFIIAVLFLLDAYANSVDKAQKESAGNKVTKRQRVRQTLKKQRKPAVIPDENLVPLLVSSNLFEVNRGEEPVSDDKPSGPKVNSNFELMGVCHFGDEKGAIVIDKNKSGTSRGKTYFTIGEEVGNGYKLYEVEDKQVVLKSGSKKITLDLAKAEIKPRRPTSSRTSRTSSASRRRRTSRRRR